MGVAGVGGNGELCQWEGVCQRCGGSKGSLDVVKRLLRGGKPVQHLGIIFETLSQGLECAVVAGRKRW